MEKQDSTKRKLTFKEVLIICGGLIFLLWYGFFSRIKHPFLFREGHVYISVIILVTTIYFIYRFRYLTKHLIILTAKIIDYIFNTRNNNNNVTGTNTINHLSRDNKLLTKPTPNNISTPSDLVSKKSGGDVCKHKTVVEKKSGYYNVNQRGEVIFVSRDAINKPVDIFDNLTKENIRDLQYSTRDNGRYGSLSSEDDYGDESDP